MICSDVKYLLPSLDTAIASMHKTWALCESAAMKIGVHLRDIRTILSVEDSVSLFEKIKYPIIDDTKPKSTDFFCCLCLLPLVNSEDEENDVQSIDSIVNFMCKPFHSKCINLWVNCVSTASPVVNSANIYL